MIFRDENWSARGKTCPSASSTKNSHGLGLTPALYGDRSVTNHLGHGTATYICHICGRGNTAALFMKTDYWWCICYSIMTSQWTVKSPNFSYQDLNCISIQWFLSLINFPISVIPLGFYFSILLLLLLLCKVTGNKPPILEIYHSYLQLPFRIFHFSACTKENAPNL
jgi:hypothetical protein